jgi:hypothetical protein
MRFDDCHKIYIYIYNVYQCFGMLQKWLKLLTYIFLAVLSILKVCWFRFTLDHYTLRVQSTKRQKYKTQQL